MAVFQGKGQLDEPMNFLLSSKYTQIEYEPVEKMLDDVDTLEEQFAEELSDLRSLLARRE